MKTAIITDSTSYLPKELLEHPDIYVVPLTLHLPDGTIMYDTDDPVILKKFYEDLAHMKELPTTSQPQMGEYYELMDELVEKGYERVFAIHIAGILSGTYQTAHSVTKEYEDRMEVNCIDSKRGACAVEYMIEKMVEALDKGKTTEEILEMVAYISKHSRIYLTVDQLRNLVRSGRLSATSAFVGTLLQVKPIIGMDADGKLDAVDKVRGQRRLERRLVELFKEAEADTPGGIEMYLAHANCPEKAESVKAAVLKEFPCHTIPIVTLGPVIGTHVASGALGVFTVPKVEI